MKKLIIPIVGFVVFSFAACNGNSESTTKDSSAGNPAAVQPPSENIPDSMKIVNDSVIVPKDSTGRSGDTMPRR